LRLRDPHRSLETLEGRAIANLEDAAKAEHHVLASAAYLRVGEAEKSQKHDAAAQLLANSVGGAVAAELALYRAAAAWNRRDLVAAQDLALQGLEIPRAEADGYQRPLPLVRAQLLETLSLVAASREDYLMQADLLDAAWRAEGGDEPRAQAVHDEWVRASLLRNFAPLVWDLHLSEHAEFLSVQSELFAWTPETAEARWVVRRALGWHAALTGDALRAFARFRDAADLAPTVPYRLASTLDRAYLAAELGQKVIHREEMGRAYHLAASIDWEHVCGEEATVLLGVVEAYAREDASVARSWLHTYDRARAMPANLMLLGSNDRRQTALERDAEGAVLAAEGNQERAATAWRSALKIWDDLGHDWRAARTALAIGELTRAPEAVADARRRSETFHRSWIGRRARRVAR